jgi:CheY-like chemotaxis protein
MPGRGSAFRFTARFRPGDPARMAADEATGAAPPGPSPLRVLLAEDNEMNRKLARIMLDRLGHAAVAARDGAEALDRLREAPVDLVLMDIEMPGMDGYEATRRIRAGEAGEAVRSVPVIAMTAHAFAEFRARAEAAGMNGYLTKPVRAAALMEAIAPFFSGPSAPAPGDGLPAGPDTAVFHWEEFLHRVGGNTELCRELVGVFLERMPVQIDRLRAALDQGDPEAIRSEAHGIKGMAANISAGRLRDIAAAVEDRAAAEDLAGAAAAGAELSDALSRLREEVQRWNRD